MDSMGNIIGKDFDFRLIEKVRYVYNEQILHV